MSADAQLYCVLIAVEGDTLLLPNAAIAETVGQESFTPASSGPAWLAGMLRWNRRTLSALRFETLNGGDAKPLGRRARLIVLQALDADTGAAPLALVAQNYPHLITVTRNALQSVPLRANDDARWVLCRVKIGNSEAVIPNVDALRDLVDGLKLEETVAL